MKHKYVSDDIVNDDNDDDVDVAVDNDVICL